MISLLDAIVVTRAKLHAKRLLLFGTIIVSGLLFALLYGAIIIFSGVTKSANEYTDAASNGHYLVKSTPVLPSSIFGPSRINPSKELIDELTTMQTDYIAQQKALAAQLKIPFDEKTIEPILIPNPYASKTASEDAKLMINATSPIFQLYIQKLQQNYVTTAKNKLTDLEHAAVPYGATAYHQNTQASTSFQTMSYLKDGKEDIATLQQDSPANSDASIYGYTTASVRNSTYSFVDDSLIQRFILPVNEKRRAQSTAIPVVITAKEATDLFGKQLDLGEKPAAASKQITWMKNLQAKINGVTYTACYRNQADQAVITQAAQTLASIENNKDSKTYVKPSLIYTLPTEPCGSLTVKEDTRTAAEKTQAETQLDISKKLGTYQAPVHQLLSFQIVGVMPVAPQTASTTDLPSFLSGLLGAEYGAGAIIPNNLYNALPPAVQHKDILHTSDSAVLNMDVLQRAGIGETIVEFNSLNQARAFMAEQGCPTQDKCDKPFTLTPYGTNYLLIDSLTTTITNILQYAFLGIACVAIIIIWFMMTRVISDSRRETAVFRAIGAKRRDIVSIYLLYSLGVALRIILFAVLFGVGTALIVQLLFGAAATDYAQVSYGVIDQVIPFSLMRFDSPVLVWITLCIAAISLVAVLPPLIRNVRRNPISDMRDE